MTSPTLHSLAATCAAGLEQLIADEITTFGGKDIQSSRGVVTWQGDTESAYRACLWSRFASRILLQTATFAVADTDQLYEQCLKIDWTKEMGQDTTFAIDCTLTKSPLNHSRYAALRVKDAIVDQFRDKYGIRPSIDVANPDLRLNLHVNGELASLAIDLSGESLHRRGYRVTGGTAPLKETLAAAIVSLSGWQELGANYMLLDPMCGSGTLLIEAALMYGDSAPGLMRRSFGFMGWKGHQPKLWSELVDEAVEREEAGLDKDWPTLLGYDSDPRVIAAARDNIEQAGLQDYIRVKQAHLGVLRRPAAKGIIITNPPYGERLSESGEVIQLYRLLGRIIQEQLSGWKAAVFIGNPDYGDRLGIKWSNSHKLYNGPIACRLFTGQIGKAEPEKETPVFEWHITEEPFKGVGEDFANRFRKNLKKQLKWAKKQNITCFRVYDRDLQEYNVTIDLYHKWVLVQEFAPPKTINEAVAAKRFKAVLTAVRYTLDVRSDRVYIKTRKRQKGKGQYQQQNKESKLREIQEGNCIFLVNFTDYLDTGIFLDHRPIRTRIQAEALGKRFLNLYGYTGTATVHAAKGKAASTTTVDLSRNYLSWAKMNMARNGFTGLAHELIESDCLQWLQKTSGEYDLIFLDPPTFSNSRKARLVFDIQADHKILITQAMRHLAANGLLLFSTNFKQFVLDPEISQRFNVVDITSKTIPADFSRSRNIHKCWEIRKN